jgi:hypothetical protein
LNPGRPKSWLWYPIAIFDVVTDESSASGFTPNRVHFDFPMSPLELESDEEGDWLHSYLYCASFSIFLCWLLLIALLVFLDCYSLNHLVASEVPVQTTQKLLAYVEKPSSQMNKNHDSSLRILYLLSAFESPSPVYSVDSLPRTGDGLVQ